jgi:hypothetical protein
LPSRIIGTRRLHLGKTEQHMAGDEIGDLVARSLGRHVHEIETEALVQLIPEEM